MEIAKIDYVGDLTTESVHLKSGSKINTDAPVDNNGKGLAFSPTDLLCASLGSCMLTVMGIVADNNNLNIKGTRITLSKIMASEPRRVGEIILDFTMPENQFSEKEKQLLKNAALNCPVAKSLKAEIKQTVKFNF
ncbi:MAG: OsmC family protein [Bacteroidetes bacterium]|nr:OsmC family protein [Bacteroidota bacterium]